MLSKGRKFVNKNIVIYPQIKIYMSNKEKIVFTTK